MVKKLYYRKRNIPESDPYNAARWVCDLMQNAAKKMYPIPLTVLFERYSDTMSSDYRLVRRYIPYGNTTTGIYHIVAYKHNEPDAWISCNAWVYMSGSWVTQAQRRYLPRQEKLF